MRLANRGRRVRASTHHLPWESLGKAPMGGMPSRCESRLACPDRPHMLRDWLCRVTACQPMPRNLLIPQDVLRWPQSGTIMDGPCWSLRLGAASGGRFVGRLGSRTDGPDNVSSRNAAPRRRWYRLHFSTYRRARFPRPCSRSWRFRGIRLDFAVSVPGSQDTRHSGAWLAVDPHGPRRCRGIAPGSPPPAAPADLQSSLGE